MAISPHGDASIYDTLRMAQAQPAYRRGRKGIRIGHGTAAAMRYTEARLQRSLTA